MHNVKEFFHIRKCTECQGFRHLAKDCKDVRSTCGSCAGRHETRRCRSPQIVCVNCNHHNLLFGTNYDIPHKASETICSCYQDEVRAYRRTRYY
ncbi:hypothetical protein AVEN_137518-1 [Araneus ventricosus]|uniref:CCHC-type domain-containing protein n=1 Tax=Araneus ventricosus TaxID=182803 RepID=A0A4Y2QGF5_ARAVE|nr:hypothetical protein AVEN_137518-1 [Araneus ventricosus]